mgnify:FL=1|jgi:hypothetical protein
MTTRILRDPKAIRVNADAEPLRQVVIDMFGIVKPFYSRQTAAYTTTGEAALEVVEVDSSSTVVISLHQSPKDGQQIIVKRMGSGAVTVDTAGAETIDGSASKSISSQYDALRVIYMDASGEYVVI